MILINPVTRTEVEAFTEEATKHLIAKGYQPVDEKKPRRTRRTRTRQ